MTFDEFKELLEFKEAEDSKRQIHYFYARLQAQAQQGITSAMFETDQEGIRAYIHNELAHKIWDLCMQAFGPTGPTYTVDDLRKAYEMGHYCWPGDSSGFEYALREINRGKGQA
jgi:hypothetical protein